MKYLYPLPLVFVWPTRECKFPFHSPNQLRIHPESGGRVIAGMIGKRSEWARNYEKRGRENAESVFSKARFFSLDEIYHLHEIKPSEIRLGLYVSPTEFIDLEQASQLEEQRSKCQQEEGAGFIVARWDKK